MPRYDAPIRDMQFILQDLLQIQNYSNLPGFEEATPDLVNAILEEEANSPRKSCFRSTLWATSKGVCAAMTPV